MLIKKIEQIWTQIHNKYFHFREWSINYSNNTTNINNNL